jgi:hypothetical protein
MMPGKLLLQRLKTLASKTILTFGTQTAFLQIQPMKTLQNNSKIISSNGK